METRGGDADRDITGLNLAAINQPLPLDYADAEASKVIVAALIQIGQNRSFAPNQCAVAVNAGIRDPADNRLKQRWLVMRHRHVVEKKERLCPRAKHVVDAHRDEVNAHGIVNAGRHSNLQLRPHTVGAGNQQWIFVLAGKQPLQLQLKDGGKAPLLAHHPGALGPPHVRRQPGHRLFVEGKINTGT